MRIELELKVCPWCKKTPHVDLPIDKSTETWQWKIHCANYMCKINPETKPASIRKTTKQSYTAMMGKLYTLHASWNHGNDMPVIEKKIVDLSKIDGAS
jgi:hypothetical protein